jgi:hypothetical protein
MRWRGLPPTRHCSSEVARQQSIAGGTLRCARCCALTSGVDPTFPSAIFTALTVFRPNLGELMHPLMR